MLPAADRIYRTEAQRLADDYRTGTSNGSLITFIAGGAVALILLLWAQWYVTRISRRILNVGMLVAAAAVAAVSVWASSPSSTSRTRSRPQQHGSDSVEVLSAATVLLSRAQGDLSLALVNRGTDETDSLDFTAISRGLVPLTREIPVLARQTRSTAAANQFGADYASYGAKAAQIKYLENRGKLTAALTLEPASAASRPG